MSEPIIIETPAPPTRERLVLVPPHASGPLTSYRDATPADLERAGWVTGGDAGFVAHRLATQRKLDDMTARVIAAERLATERVASAMAADARAEKAERERDEEKRHAGDAADALTRLMRERGTLRDELARLTAPGEGSEGEPTDAKLLAMLHGAEGNLSDGYRALWRRGVAHERARQRPAKDRATDEELCEVYMRAIKLPPLVVDHAAVAAVAAHVRQERCLVAQAVGMGVSICTVKERDGRWFVEAKDHSSVVQPADVPATLARLLGEVGK